MTGYGPTISGAIDSLKQGNPNQYGTSPFGIQGWGQGQGNITDAFSPNPYMPAPASGSGGGGIFGAPSGPSTTPIQAPFSPNGTVPIGMNGTWPTGMNKGPVGTPYFGPMPNQFLR